MIRGQIARALKVEGNIKGITRIMKPLAVKEELVDAI
jgi:hypothetical protein